MLAARAAAVGFTVITVAKAMTSAAATTSSEPRGLHASAGRDARSGSPRQRLQKLLAVPGYDPSRVNDLLLLRPAADGQAAPEAQEKSSNRHVVFFHGDIQVSAMEGTNTCVCGSGRGLRLSQTGLTGLFEPLMVAPETGRG